jgi:plastocyanin
VSATPPPRRRRRRASVGVTLLAVPTILLVVGMLASGPRGEPIVVEVPLGTAARIEAGEVVELLPAALEASVGDTLEIRNHDLVTHEVGPYRVAAGETVLQTFTSPGTIQGTCTVNPMGEVTIIVR